MRELLLVTPELLPYVWNHVEDMVLEEKKHWEEDFDLEDIYEWLKAGKLFMWCTNDEREFTSIIIGCFCELPKSKTFNILYSNINDLDDIISLLDCIEVWAKQVGANEVTVLARRAGWSRKLHNRGYSVTYHTVAKNVSTLGEHH